MKKSILKKMIYIAIIILLFLALSSILGGFKPKISENINFDFKKVDSISIISFNTGLLQFRLLGIKILEPATYLEQRLKKMPEEILKTNADIILFQEIYFEKYKKYMINELKETYPFYVYYTKSFIFDFGLDNGLLILSKYPIIDKDFKQFKSISFHEKLSINSGFLYAKIQISQNKTISVVNSHNTARGIFRGENSNYIVNLKSNQIKEITDYSKTKNVDFIGGDYNSGPNFFPKMYNIFLENNYSEAFEQLYPNSEFVTWDITNPLSQNDLFPDTPPQKDDHIFMNQIYDSVYSVSEAKVVLDEKVVEVNGKIYPLSDHYGVYACFKINKDK